MPTLSSIQGSSLTPRTNIVENLLQGTRAGREISETRAAGSMDKILRDAASKAPVTGGATGGNVTTGNAGPAGSDAPVVGPSAGAPSGPAPSSPPGGQPQSYLDVITSPEIQRQLVEAGGAQGAEMALQLNKVAVAVQAQKAAARQEQLDSLANLSVGLQELDFGAQTQALEQIRMESQGDPNILRFVDRINRMGTKEERDIALRRAVDRATSISDSIGMRQDALAAQIDQQNADAASANAAANVSRLGISQQQADTARARLNQYALEYQQAEETERRAVADKVVGPVLDSAFSTASTARSAQSLINRIESVLDTMDAAGGGPVTAGMQERIAQAAGYISPEFGDAMRRLLPVGSSIDTAVLNNQFAQLLQNQIGNMNKAGFSDRDLMVYERTLPGMDLSDTAKMRAVLGEVRESVRNSENNAIDLIDISRRPVNEGGGSTAVINKFVEISRRQRESATSNAENKQNWPGAPSIGTKRGGYTYQGGDPNNQQSWVKN